MTTKLKPQPEAPEAPAETPTRTSKLGATTVQAAIASARSAGWKPMRLGKHITALTPSGEVFYLGGGVEAPTWRAMRPLLEADDASM